MSTHDLPLSQDRAGPEGVATPAAAVIIPHYNDAARLGRCLDALARNPRPLPVEILVVDNGSTESLEPLAARHPEVRFVTEPGRGAATARNSGVAVSSAPRLFFLDADCIPAEDWLATAFRRIEGAQIVGGAVRIFDETPPPRSGAQAFETVFAFQQESYVRDHGFAVTANLLTWRDVFEDTGPLVNGLAEDKEWCLRARARGYRITYAADLVVAHPSRADWPALRRKWLRLTREGFALTGAGQGGHLSWLARAGLVLLSPFGHLPKVLLSPRLSSGAERLRASQTLFRLRFARAGWMLRQALGRPLDEA
ncbi:glycosyltransferase (plasmid) [Salipiger sp. H15]|uniref:Glycosyltransferase n=1 Tax=Alloyangia sp. H15 TaxID=3029062 RepID=A0AAU8ARE2_9RHOB